MPATDDKTLSQTIRQVMTEQPKAASAPAPVQAAEGISTGTTGETQSGGTPEYVSGIDISTLPEQERPIARKVLADKAKLLEDGYQAKFKEVSQFKKQREEILSLGISENEAVQVLRDHVTSKTTAKEAKKETSQLIDQLMESAPDLETRKGLENLKAIIKEQTNIDAIQKKLELLENYVKHSQGREFQTREQSLNSAMDSLSTEYGKEFIDKYRDTVVREGLKFTDADPEQLLGAIANPKELKQAILSNVPKKESERKQEKINAVSSAGSGITSPAQTLDIRKTSMKGIMSEIFASQKR